MAYRVYFEGAPAGEDFYAQLSGLEVEENADLPGAISMTLPLGIARGELSWVSDPRLRPYANIAVVATGRDSVEECVFEGYVLTHKAHLPAGAAGATLEVWGQDSTVLMGLTEVVKTWTGSEADIARQIFSTYGFTDGPNNAREPGPTYADDKNALIQRSSDADFLRRLARRTGRWFRVVADRPGRRTGVFAPPDLDAASAVTITLPGTAAVLDFSWDASRPTAVQTRQVSLSDDSKDGVSADTSDSGLTALDARTLAAFAGRTRSVVLTTAASTAALAGRASGLLRESNWFVRCEGTADATDLGRILRVGQVVTIAGCGSLLSGRYLVWSVRHTFTTQAHSMAFALVRNALGSEG